MLRESEWEREISVESAINHRGNVANGSGEMKIVIPFTARYTFAGEINGAVRRCVR